MDSITAKAIKAAADGIAPLVNLPDLLVKMVMDPQVTFLERKERIQKLKELAELREIAKVIVSIIFVKGGVIGIAEELTKNPRIEDIKWLKDDLATAADLLDKLLEILMEASFSNTSLVVEAVSFIPPIQRAYRTISQAPDEALLSSGKLGDLFDGIVKVHEAGIELIKKIDDHRRVIDGTWG